MNAINNNPVTMEDIALAEAIFGSDIGSLKGKTTRQKPMPVVNNQVEIPRELIAAQKHVTLYMDTMNVNGLSFLTTISGNIYYRTAQLTVKKTAREYEECLGEIFRLYQAANFTVTEIICDNEYQDLKNPMADKFNIRMNFANPQEHVPQAERNIRVIKERVRATFHRLPFDHLPKIMVNTLVQESAKKLNFFPAKNGISNYYSPRTILHQENLDFDRHCKFAFGTYVQAHDESNPTNTNRPRTLDCIYLRNNSNRQGGHVLLHLPTSHVITRRNITPLPITPAVIEQVNALARADKMPKGLKVSNKTGRILYDATWLEGVDYQEEDYEINPEEDDHISIETEYSTETEEQDEQDDEIDNEASHRANPSTFEPEEPVEIIEEEEPIQEAQEPIEEVEEANNDDNEEEEPEPEPTSGDQNESRVNRSNSI